MGKREEAATILNGVPKTKEGIQSDTQPDLFFQWTGMTHAGMKKSWLDNPKKGQKLLTACGGFAGTFAWKIGISGIADIFNLEKSLTESGMSHAWVEASSGAKPLVGDILRHTIFHVDVAAGWDGAKLKRVAAGQSRHDRPADAKAIEKEFDALKWVTGGAAYNSANLIGWLDLDKYFGPKPALGAPLTWLLGWWKVWDGIMYYYYFGAKNVVKYTKVKPVDLTTGPKHPNNVGTYRMDPQKGLIVTWNKIQGVSVNCVETFHNAGPGVSPMNATSTLYGNLVATKLG